MAAEPQRPPKNPRRPRTRAPRPPRGGSPGSPDGGPPQTPAADLARRLAQVGKGHREAGDAYACTVLNFVSESRWMAGLEHWTVAYPIPMPRLYGDHGNLLEPDSVIFCSMIAGDTVEQLQERTDRKQQSGSQEREPVSITNVEARMRQQPGRDAEQMREIRAALERRFGLLVPIDSMQFLVGANPPTTMRYGWRRAPASSTSWPRRCASISWTRTKPRRRSAAPCSGRPRWSPCATVGRIGT